MNCKKIALLLSALAYIPSAYIFAMMPLDPIERKLVEREIKQKGLAVIQKTIKEAPEPKPFNTGFHSGWTTPTILTINTTFKQKDKETDPLTKEVFDLIQKKESKRPYIPKDTLTPFSGSVGMTCANNSLGSETRYYWQKNASIKVKAKLTNKPELQQIVDNYTE